MRVNKVYEDIETENTVSQFINNLVDKFFSNVEEFDIISVKYDSGVYVFRIYFTAVFKETIESLEEFDNFMGYTGWSLTCEISEGRTPYARVFEEFHLGIDRIEEYMEKFEMEKDANKYNL